MGLYRVYYTVGGKDGTDDVLAHSSTEAMKILEDLLLEWGYPNGQLQVDFAEKVASII